MRIPISKWEKQNPGKVLYKANPKSLGFRLSGGFRVEEQYGVLSKANVYYKTLETKVLDLDTIEINYSKIVIPQDIEDRIMWRPTTEPDTLKVAREGINTSFKSPVRSNRPLVGFQVRWKGNA